MRYFTNDGILANFSPVPLACWPKWSISTRRQHGDVMLLMRRMTYIHELSDWPQFRWDCQELEPKLGAVRHRQCAHRFKSHVPAHAFASIRARNCAPYTVMSNKQTV